ncbi:rhamnulokinase [Amycolatopsis marina]|uniref:Rhamnulokinase n=1 Tax=Amycolatopsis marina TaxID=490629 RepID=A0A1I1CD85_9PSEU|nr:rhamnulokinase family protein [Amycolatopsis marina]SFB60639.1 rhamnulokinase [Amycolatopsis marina]
MDSFVAVDLGASSGRVMLGEVTDGRIALSEVRRFATGPRERPEGGLRWDVGEMEAEIRAGLADTACARPVSVGIDSWAVDYGLLGPDGQLSGDVRCYRDPRTDGMAERLRATVDDATLYGMTGLQYLPFNTIYQLLAEPPERLADARMLLLPDLLAYRLTGRIGAEVTNASTTGLLDASTRRWSTELLARTPIPAPLLPPLRGPGERIGVGPGGIPVVAVASHDTASAVAAVPASGSDFGYISCGTWSLVGLELPSPVLDERARMANFTNEAGIDGTVRFLRNTMGLWLLSESLRVWNGRGLDVDLAQVLTAAEAEPAFGSVVDPDDPVFLTPGDMPERIADVCGRTGQPVPRTPPAVVRTILESLALAHARSLDTAARLSGRRIRTVHLVGGGARNELLCQLTADACGLPVHAGPVEASAIGNIGVQARAAGMLQDIRSSSAPIATYFPRGRRSRWDAAARRAGLR